MRDKRGIQFGRCACAAALMAAMAGSGIAIAPAAYAQDAATQGDGQAAATDPSDDSGTSDEPVADGWHEEDGQVTYWENGAQVKSRWVEAERDGETGPFWIDAEGHLAVQRFVNPNTELDTGAGYVARVTKTGAVRTGKFVFRNRLLIADSKGEIYQAKKGFKKVKLASDKKKSLHYYAPIKREKGIYGLRIGYFRAKDKRYYADKKTGVVFSDGTRKMNGKLYYADKKGSLSKISSIRYRMIKKAKSYKSRTKYLIMVDTNRCRCGVFEKHDGHWDNIRYWPCTVGKRRSPTVKGTYRTFARGYSFGDTHTFGHGFTCYWYTRFHRGYMLHSQTYHHGTHRILHGGIGNHLSHGCVRLHIQDAKWIYKKVPLGTTVHTY